MITEVVYFVRAGSDGLIKIGTTSDVEKRLAKMQTDSGVDLVLIGVLTGGQELERKLHEQFSLYRARGEWFFPHSEILTFVARNCTEQIVQFSRRQKWSRMPTNALQAWRFSQRLVLTRAAKGFGISQAGLSRLENGEMDPSLALMRVIARVTGGAVMPNDFLGFDPREATEKVAA